MRRLSASCRRIVPGSSSAAARGHRRFRDPARAGGAALSMALGALIACSSAAPPEPRVPEVAAEEPAMEAGGAEPSAEGASAEGATSADTTGGGATRGDASGDVASGDPFADPAGTSPAASAAPESTRGAKTSEAGASATSESGEGMISFFEIGRGDRVADLGGLFGYSLEPFLDAVGGAGVVYARLRPGLKPDALPYSEPDRGRQGELVWMKTPLTAPFTQEATRLNVVTLLYAYHSVVAAGQNRKALNDSVYAALVPGGTYIIVDHAAPPGSGLAAAASMNRIEDRIVRSEVEASGFQFIEAADFVLNAVRTSDRPAPSQYVLKFKKPR